MSVSIPAISPSSVEVSAASVVCCMVVGSASVVSGKTVVVSGDCLFIEVTFLGSVVLGIRIVELAVVVCLAGNVEGVVDVSLLGSMGHRVAVSKGRPARWSGEAHVVFSSPTRLSLSSLT